MFKLKQHASLLTFGTMMIFVGLSALMPAIATAPMPPSLEKAKLNGKSIYVLYVTRSSDRVLVRCYPGQQPSVAVTQKANGTKEGILTCVN
jgi:hypothetical protein